MTRFGVLTLTLVLLAAGCGEDKLVDRPPEQPIREQFPQIKASSIDILFVVDNSGSMEQEQDALSANFGKFLEFVDPDPTRTGEIGEVDYHLAITTTDASRTGGALVGTPQIIEPDGGQNPLELFQANVKVGTSGGALESGFEAALAALENARQIRDEDGPVFLREKAYLYIIFVTDEDDASFGEVTHYFRRFETIKGIGNEGTIALSAITVPTNGSCTTGRPGARYEEIARLSGGVVGDICDPDWSSTLRQLAISGIGLRKRFQLDQPPRDLDGNDVIDHVDVTVDVRYPCWVPQESPYLAEAVCAEVFDECDGAVDSTLGRTCMTYNDAHDGWSFDPAQNTIVFDGAAIPGPGARVDVSYFPRKK